MRIPSIATALVFVAYSTAQTPNSTYYNPVIPGWHSDPSCVYVDETFFCATSTFLAVPGIPIYASKDLINWKLISHAWTRPDQLGLPNAARDVDYQMGGFYAPNLRHRDGIFYLTNVYVAPIEYEGLPGVIFRTNDIYDSSAWSDGLVWNATGIDPDLFWDDDGTVYLDSIGIVLQEIDLETGEVTEPTSIWNGTGLPYPEGPHIYKRDGWYYLAIAEGGTELGHRANVARSRNITGPYEGDPSNPFLTNNDTSEYFQTVGHVELFQGESGNWWGLALATRSGPEWEVYPMGRESVLFPVTWEEGEWPVASQIRGIMSGWPLPPWRRDVPGMGPFVQDPDIVDFEPGSSIPNHFLFWRFPDYSSFSVSPRGHPCTFEIQPSRSNLTGIPQSNDTAVTGKLGLSFISRRQTHTLFSYSVDLSFNPQHLDQEAAVSVFLTQFNHLDLGIARFTTASSNSNNNTAFELRLRTETFGTINGTIPSSTEVTPLPSFWSHASTIRLQIHTANSTHYAFTAFPGDNANEKIIAGYVSASVVSGGSGPFTGTLLGVYATCHGAGKNGQKECPGGGEAYFSRWRYSGAAQEIEAGIFLPTGAL